MLRFDYAIASFSLLTSLIKLWTLIYPADVVKSRMQVRGEGRFLHVFIDTFRNEGDFLCVTRKS